MNWSRVQLGPQVPPTSPEGHRDQHYAVKIPYSFSLYRNRTAWDKDYPFVFSESNENVSLSWEYIIGLLAAINIRTFSPDANKWLVDWLTQLNFKRFDLISC